LQVNNAVAWTLSDGCLETDEGCDIRTAPGAQHTAYDAHSMQVVNLRKQAAACCCWCCCRPPCCQPMLTTSMQISLNVSLSLSLATQYKYIIITTMSSLASASQATDQ